MISMLSVGLAVTREMLAKFRRTEDERFVVASLAIVYVLSTVISNELLSVDVREFSWNVCVCRIIMYHAISSTPHRLRVK
jgi:hypothetical protein